ncbi:unnamed protein product [Cuscuta europaea]|uniref:GAG-pre-integrase domain-containing protein n=1 Tax=Cuscuta europaea TaxID=41803 RepID=A0A9P1E5H2_CUSEU|nr:unnamed protein product [Cuscuta europaea]
MLCGIRPSLQFKYQTVKPCPFILLDLPSRKLIEVARCRNGLYYLEDHIGEREAMTVSPNFEVWHQRLGHASDEKIRHIFQDFKRPISFCDSCVRSKQTRIPFPTGCIKTQQNFDLIHCDIWGGYNCPSFTGERYFLTIVDDYTRSV